MFFQEILPGAKNKLWRNEFTGTNRKEALRHFKTWEARWLVEEERAVKCMKKDLFNCLHFYDFPPERWKSIRTTNILERAFREVRRRTPP
jgi:transposase-like protein